MFETCALASLCDTRFSTGTKLFAITSPKGLTQLTSVAALAVLASALAYILYFRLIGRVGPTLASTVTFLVPVFAIVYGALFLGERLDRFKLLAVALGVLRALQTRKAQQAAAAASAQASRAQAVMTLAPPDVLTTQTTEMTTSVALSGSILPLTSAMVSSPVALL